MRLLKIPEVADLLGVTVPRAYQMARNGILPVVHLGKNVRVERGQLEAWIASGGSGVHEEAPAMSAPPAGAFPDYVVLAGGELFRCADMEQVGFFVEASKGDEVAVYGLLQGGAA